MQLDTTGTQRFRALAVITMAAALMRLLPHPYNFTPIAGMALFGGAQFKDTRIAFAVPLIAMLLSDLVLAATVYGTTAFRGIPYVYLAFAFTVVLRRWLGPRSASSHIGTAAVAAALLFYLIANFGVWMRGTLYPMTWEGFVTCYTVAIPYLRNAILGNLFYAAILFGGFRLAQRRFAALRIDAPAIAEGS